MATSLPRLSPDFVAEAKATRIIDAAGRLFSAHSYKEICISDLVKEAGVARKTLYDNFSGKDAIGLALVRRVSPGVAERLGDGPIKRRTVAVLAVEIAARVHTLGSSVLEEQVKHLLRALDEFDPTQVNLAPPGSPLRSTLPPGPHTLPGGFVAENYSQRLFSGFAWTMAEQGFAGATIADITSRAAVSRRTFYERFSGVDEITEAFLEFAGVECPNDLLVPLAAEILGAGVHLGRKGLDARREEAEGIVAELAAAREMQGRET